MLKDVRTTPQMSTLMPSPPLLYETTWQQKISINDQRSLSLGKPRSWVQCQAAELWGVYPGFGKAEQISPVARDLDDIFLFPFFRTEKLLEIILDNKYTK